MGNPPEGLATLDLTLAWQRVRGERSQAFIRFPHEVELVELDLATWLTSIQDRINSGAYVPSPAIHCDVPKKKWMIRPGSYVSLTDRVVYTACVSACLPQIRKATDWAQGTHDFGYIPTPPLNAPVWFEHPMECWKRFRNRSLSLLRERKYSAILSSDLVGFYENISIDLLHSDLAQASVHPEINKLIRDCLRMWSPTQSRDRGLPQSVGASHLLAKFYFNPIDRALTNGGYTHHRYVDDMMFYCADLNEAKRVIVELSSLLRGRGLTMHAEKSQIQDPVQSRVRFEGAQAKIRSILETAAQDEAESIALANPYLTIDELNEIISQLKQEVNEEAYVAALRMYFTESTNPEESFDKSLFHFILGGLARKGNRSALQYCLASFPTHPEETEAILKYFVKVAQTEVPDDQVADFLSSTSAVYPFQVFQIAEWALNRSIPLSQKLLSVFRTIAWDASKPSYLRATCKAILGQNGEQADLDRLWRSYSEEVTELERVVTVVSLRKLERGRRNEFYASIEKQSDGIHRAVGLAKSLAPAHPATA